MKFLFLICALFWISWNVTFANNRLQLRNIGFKEGLNNMNVSAIAQDQLGYIWVATMGGVSRYNGYEFKRYYFDSVNPASLVSNHVTSLFCSSGGLMFIGTEKGLDCYDSQMDKLISYFPDFKNVILSFAERDGFIYMGTDLGLFRFKAGSSQLEELDSNFAEKPSFNFLLFDKDGNLWCGLASGRGLARYNPKDKRFDFYRNDKVTDIQSYNSVKTLFLSKDNILLLGTNGGISCFDLTSKQYIDSPGYFKLQEGLAGRDVRFIIEKEPSLFWIGTLQSGLFTFEKTKNALEHYSQGDGFDELHSNNCISSLTDKSGNVWLGTFDAGLDVVFEQSRNFNFDVSLNKMTQRKFITSITKDLKGNLLIATRENGFFIYNIASKSYKAYDKSNSQLENPNIRTVMADSENKYWIGSYGGLQIFDTEKRTFKMLAVPKPNFGAVCIIQIQDRVFVGTQGQGILVFDLQGKLLIQFLKQGSTIPKIVQLNDKELLFTSYGSGIFALNIYDHAIQRIEWVDTRIFPGLLNSVTAHKDKEGILWLGTYNYGMYRLDFKNSEVKNFNVREGLPSTDVISIKEDDNNNLWLSTSYGLVRFNKNNFIINTYFVNEGTNNYQFHENAAFKDERGIIFFGGNSGVTYFDPEEILSGKSDTPRVVLDNLYIQNHLITPSDGEGILDKSLPYSNGITLSYDKQYFSIDFVSFDYSSPEKMKYFYILEGYDKEWISIGSQRRVSYSNLPRGNYIFKMKSVNGVGIPSMNIAQLKIRVKPAPWFSYLAWAIYMAIIGVISWLIFKLRIRTYVYKKELEIEHFEHLREHEINLMKQKFFTNISHELRTPLTLIYGLVTQLSRHDKLSPAIREYAYSLDLNVSRLLKLINQLLTYKKIESETLTLWLENINLNDEVHKIVELFTIYARDKEINIDIIENDNFMFWFDCDKFEKILSNLLSNAIKHTGKGGRIEVIVRKIQLDSANPPYKSILLNPKSEYIEICVRDNGEGIDKKEWNTIFDRYKQIETDGRQRPDYSGTGIGLNFTKSLIELHKGDIQLISDLGKGSTFSFILPLDSSVFGEKDFAVSKIIDKEPEMPTNIVVDDESVGLNQLEMQSNIEKTVLIVEDDPQLNMFLVNSLKSFYKTMAVHDGETGLKIVKQYLPDLVISDVMMPKMDGFQLTKSIKEDGELCHIPVILLTSKTETVSQIDGMQAGADMYITKPFYIDFLLAAIDSQLKNRKRIHNIFMNGKMPKFDRSEMNHLDIQFLSKLNALLEKELSNPDLDILLLAKNMNMSRSAFYRKFMGLTKLSPITYLKKYRIVKAIELLNQNKYTLIEISEMTGFGSPSYFSRAFKQEKGISPREFVH